MDNDAGGLKEPTETAGRRETKVKQRLVTAGIAALTLVIGVVMRSAADPPTSQEYLDLESELSAAEREIGGLSSELEQMTEERETLVADVEKLETTVLEVEEAAADLEVSLADREEAVTDREDAAVE